MSAMSDALFNSASVDTRPHACAGEVCQVCALDRDRAAGITRRVPGPGALARRGDPGTSKAAARNLDRESMLHALLSSFETISGTAEETALRADIDPWAASKRVSDLLNAGLIEVATVNGKELQRRGSSGKFQRVLRITDRGRASLASKQ